MAFSQSLCLRPDQTVLPRFVLPDMIDLLVVIKPFGRLLERTGVNRVFGFPVIGNNGSPIRPFPPRKVSIHAYGGLHDQEMKPRKPMLPSPDD